MEKDSFFKDGTWDVFFANGLRAPHDSRVGWAVLSIKFELVFNGVPQGGMEMGVASIGQGTDRAIKTFQQRNALEVDGVVGPKTAKVLIRKRAKLEANRVHAPDMLIAQQLELESADDFACVSANMEDRGPAQINGRWHPEVSDSSAYDVTFCVRWQADYMREAYDGVLTVNGKKDWDLALAAYNVGWAAARAWDKAGRPKTTTAGQYVAAVHSRTG
jgi:hypothetical protein